MPACRACSNAASSAKVRPFRCGGVVLAMRAIHCALLRGRLAVAVPSSLRRFLDAVHETRDRVVAEIALTFLAHLNVARILRLRCEFRDVDMREEKLLLVVHVVGSHSAEHARQRKKVFGYSGGS